LNIETEVLIIGGGAAAARATIEAVKKNLSVTMVIKEKFPSGSTVISMGYMSAVVRDDDNPELFYQDIIKGGYSLNNKKLAKILASESYSAYQDLVDFGTEFRTTRKGVLYITQPSGMTRNRSFGAINHMFMKGLNSEVKKSPAQIFEGVMITDLIEIDNKIIGAVGFNYKTGEFISISAKSIIIATGGLGQIFQHNSMPLGATGDGYAMGLRVGAELVDMEFIQAMTSVIWPTEIKGLAPPFDGLVKFGARFYNGLNERFMEQYEPEKLENVTRDIACICGYKEIKAGRATSHGGLIMDISKIPWNAIKNLMPKIYNAYARLGLDATKAGIEWVPGCHHEMGGLKINERCETSIKGLYAAGEVAGGVHGANRLGGNSLTATQVFGKIAGNNAANYASDALNYQIPDDLIKEKKRAIFNIYERTEGINYLELREKIKQIMSQNVWVIKTESRMKRALDFLLSIRNEANINLKLPKKNYQNLKGAIETLNMLEVSEIITRASIIRKESRGAHFREDYPEIDDKNWLKNIVMYKENGDLKYRIDLFK